LPPDSQTKYWEYSLAIVVETTKLRGAYNQKIRWDLLSMGLLPTLDISLA